MPNTLTPIDPILSRQKKILSVTGIARCLARNYTQTDIAKLYQVSKQAVSEYIHNHAEDLDLLLDTNDDIISLKAKAVAHKAMEKLDNVLDEEMSKKDMVGLNIVSGTHIDKYRDLQGKSTPNIVILGADLSGFLVKKVGENLDNQPESEGEIIDVTPLPEPEK